MNTKFIGLAFAALAVALGSTAAATAQQHDRRVRIVNASSATMTYFYASNVDRDTWEEDILGNSVLHLPAGNAVMVNIDDGSGYCLFDLRAVFADGSEAVEWGVNVCEIATFTFTD